MGMSRRPILALNITISLHDDIINIKRRYSDAAVAVGDGWGGEEVVVSVFATFTGFLVGAAIWLHDGARDADINKMINN